MRISDWSSDVGSSDLGRDGGAAGAGPAYRRVAGADRAEFRRQPPRPPHGGYDAQPGRASGPQPRDRGDHPRRGPRPHPRGHLVNGGTIADRHVHPATVPLRFLQAAPSTLLGLPEAFAYLSDVGLATVLSFAPRRSVVLIFLKWITWSR